MPAKKVTKGEAERLTVTLDAKDRASLQRVADRLDRSLAWVVRTALQDYLEQHGEVNQNGKEERG